MNVAWLILVLRDGSDRRAVQCKRILMHCNEHESSNCILRAGTKDAEFSTVSGKGKTEDVMRNQIDANGGYMKHQVIQKIVLSLSCLALFSAIGSSYAAQDSKRTGKWETSFDMNYLNSSTIDFGGGNSVKTNSNMGWIIAFGYNFDEKLNLALDLGWNSVNYQVSEAGQPPASMYGGNVSTSTTKFDLTYNFMAKRFTPFVSGNIGWAWIDSNIPNGPPASGCYWDPWYGYICSGYQSTYATTKFGYGGSLGLRFELNDMLFLRGSVGKQWIDSSSASGTPSFTNYRFDLGFMY
jgi:hypothetical protein